MTSLTGGEMDSDFRRNDGTGENLTAGNVEPFSIEVGATVIPAKAGIQLLGSRMLTAAFRLRGNR